MTDEIQQLRQRAVSHSEVVGLPVYLVDDIKKRR